jgi:hypothetical protein
MWRAGPWARGCLGSRCAAWLTAAALAEGLLMGFLVADLTMVPVTVSLAASLDQAAAGDERISSAWVLLRQPIAALARRISAVTDRIIHCGVHPPRPGPAARR